MGSASSPMALLGMGLVRGRGVSALANLTSDDYLQIANVMLIITCVGASNALTTARGISDVLWQTRGELPINPLSWLV